MKSVQIGSAAWAPVSPEPRNVISSKPTQTPVATSGEKPTNHASAWSFVVPVLPATGRPRLRARCPVPSSTTARSMSVTR